MNLRRNLLIALMAAVLCVLSPWAVPIGPVPVTLATFGLYLIIALLGIKGSAAAVGLYLVLGGVGVPVFAGFAGGFQQLVGLTGGYLWGYLPAALIGGLLAKHRWRFALPLAFAAATVVIYTVGTLWYCLSTAASVESALLTCVLPFLPADGVKIAAASFLAPALRRHIR